MRVHPLSALSVALVAAGFLGGALFDEEMPRPDIRRGGYRVLEADFHAHTRFSDGFLSPFDLVLQARRRGLDVLAVTEHNNIFPAKLARTFSEWTGGPTILVGEEVTTNRFHLHGIGLHDWINPNQSVSAVIDAIHAQGAIAIAAHPVGRYWSTYLPFLDKLDATEVMHPLAYGASGRGWAWTEMRDFYVNAHNAGHRLAAIGSSDYHFFSPLGVARTLVFADDTSAAAVMAALRAGRTLTYDLEGNAYGDAALAQVIRNEPYTFKKPDYNYDGRGPIDRMLRIAGWLGALGLVLFRRR